MKAPRATGVLLMVSLASCALLTRKPPPAIQYYVLAVPGTPPTPLTAPLEMGSFTADQPYATERIAYRTSPYRIDYYVYNRWAADPRSMVAAAARDYLGKAPAADDGPPLELSAHIRRIEEIDEPNGTRQGAIAVDVKVVQDGRIVLAHDYGETEPAKSANVESVVEAQSRALGRILDQVAAALATPAAGKRQPSSSGTRYRSP